MLEYKKLILAAMVKYGLDNRLYEYDLETESVMVYKWWDSAAVYVGQFTKDDLDKSLLSEGD